MSEHLVIRRRGLPFFGQEGGGKRVVMVGANRRCGTVGHVNRGLWLVASTWNFNDKKVTHVKE